MTNHLSNAVKSMCVHDSLIVMLLLNAWVDAPRVLGGERITIVPASDQLHIT